MMRIKTLEEELREFLGDWDWPAFESTETGHIRLDDNPKKYPYDFYMRVGLHMKRPMQVVVSCGKYVKMRKAEKWASYPLRDIDPWKPETTLYEDQNYAYMQQMQLANYQYNQLGVFNTYGQQLSQLPMVQSNPVPPKPKKTWRPSMPVYLSGTIGLGQAVNIPNSNYQPYTVWTNNTTGAVSMQTWQGSTISTPMQGVTTTTGSSSALSLGAQPSLPWHK